MLERGGWATHTDAGLPRFGLVTILQSQNLNRSIPSTSADSLSTLYNKSPPTVSMGRRSKKKKSRALSSELMSRQIDLPVASFSECPDKTLRQPKRSSVAVTDFSKSSSDDIEDDIPDDWTEREVDEEEDEDEILSISRVKLSNCQAEETEENVSLIQSHRDFWHLLSRYIAPAEVGKFALICKSSYYTVATQGFWRRLYLHHYNPVLHYDLPERFQPDCMRRPKGLRAEVIKMLHQTDRQFLERQSRASSIWPDPHLLTARICSLQTSNRIGKRSVFHYFKLTEVARPKLLTVERSEDSCDEEEGEDIGDKTKTRKLLADLSDIYFNPEEGSKVLQVNAANWSSIPPVMGLKLLSVSLSVSHAMRYHKLKMIFGSPISASCSRSPMDQESSQVVIDSVCGLKVLDWWHPQYQRIEEFVSVDSRTDDLFGL